LARVDVEAGGDRPIEEIRLAERHLVLPRLRALLQRHADRLTAAEEVRRLERELAEEAVELRNAGAERQLVAVLLFELQLDVDLVVHAGGRRDVHLAFLALERLEVADLIEAADALFQRFGVEQPALVDAHLAADDAVVRGRVAEKR